MLKSGRTRAHCGGVRFTPPRNLASTEWGRLEHIYPTHAAMDGVPMVFVLLKYPAIKAAMSAATP
eukprot:CAMPEP_0197854384 /NCGR_PEP_ID=MMETSP1438-20131217/24577_1 /TAXON_ID=1461541 /ORGANISM="Pterosperma sp., Strain CCMP1384" /LENGTH=64 /DNA_ID=CAMNT_0043469095 /DNA_START=937 /DNA_END=1127 /DNA_ORIENTATION=+